MSDSAFSDQRLLNQLQAVLFDLDGTLLDTARDLVNALQIVCAAQGQPAPDPQLAARYVSHGAIGLVRLAFPQLNAAELEPLRAQLVQSLSAEYLCAHRRLPRDTRRTGQTGSELYRLGRGY